jgi:hypothetical protein
MPTTTGFNRHLDAPGVRIANEWLRQGLAVVSEVNADAVAAPTATQTFNLIRRVQTHPGNPAASVPPTFVAATGLNNIKGSVILPAAWNSTQVVAGQPILRETERVVYLVDVPGGKVLLTDRIEFVDAVYGATVFRTTSVTHNVGAGIVRLVVEWAKERDAP